MEDILSAVQPNLPLPMDAIFGLLTKQFSMKKLWKDLPLVFGVVLSFFTFRVECGGQKGRAIARVTE